MPAPPPPPPPVFGTSTSTSADQGRNLLLQSIRAGKTLKKTVTVDKSGPAVTGRVKGESINSPLFSNSGNNGPNVLNSNISNNNNGGPIGLGGLFSSGMPKLKPTGLRTNAVERDASTNVNVATFTQASIGLSHTMKRGPPPIPPPATQKPQVFSQVQSGLDNATTSTENPKGFGKPTFAPKPPPPPPSTGPLKPSPPPKKLNLTSGGSVSRAQSMRLPRSPPVLAPTPPSLHQSQDCLNETQPRSISRVLRPPVARPPSPPVSRIPVNSNISTVTRAAPPPPSRVVVSAPCMPPPPPPPLPHRPAPTHQRLAPPPPPPPTPPTRGLSIRNGQAANSIDLEVRFAEMFHSISSFPQPEPFRGFTKVYSSRNAAKQQAPAPPLQTSSTPSAMLPINVSSGGKQWHHNAASLTC